MKHKQRTFLLSLLLPALALFLSSCGNQAEARPTAQPDQLQIQIIEVGSHTPHPLLTYSNKLQVQRLYTLIYTFPYMPEHQPCTMEMGPSYQLIFKQHDYQLVTMKADRYGCKPITIDHEKRAGKPIASSGDSSIKPSTTPSHTTIHTRSTGRS
ncbi:hypothetical protein KDW_59470 [Dictyobacter vulcani]|uniref:Lipoprotein n=1 Tax=Dictyobacter vulcani TaxID=2607529 RepID=A0A5J4KV11_9CHLR|nr:hypothetical protein [Dictyobacter vulcani]GER91785.1 hypothetical protein KDW_59470 [Dictyobacter vulcani]